MSQRQLAERLQITPQSVADIEKAEAEDRITLATLKRVARALQSEAQVTIVPTQPINAIILGQARKLATRLTQQTQTHMRLEDQGTAESFQREQVEKLTHELAVKKAHKLWDER